MITVTRVEWSVNQCAPWCVSSFSQ